MSYGISPDSRLELETFADKYLQWYDGRRRTRRLSRKQRAMAGADLLDIIDMLEILLYRHQMIFEIDRDYPWALYFPYLFIAPKQGDKIINKVTNEIYEILWVETLDPNDRRFNPIPIVKNKKSDIFTGRIILKEGNRAPRFEERLEFRHPEKNVINFFEWSARRHMTKPTGPSVDASEQQVPAPFVPSITWSIRRSEPGSISKHPFDPAKEVKPRLREEFPDPDRTYLIPSQDAQDIASLRFTNWASGLPQTGEPIVTGCNVYTALEGQLQNPMASTHTISVYGQWFDNIVQFDCWSNDNWEANALISWFEDFMDLYGPVLKKNGVNEVLYWQRTQDQTIERWRDDIDNRTIHYFFRTEKLRAERSRNFRQFNIRVQVSNRGDPLLLSEPTGISTFTGLYGSTPSAFSYDRSAGVFYTGDGRYAWGTLVIEE